jgi:hypothetical protein
VKIILSRHVKNNMRLYGIVETDIIDALRMPNYTEEEGDRTIVIKKFPNRFSGFPLKVVYEEGYETYVVTAYPLKRKYRRNKT